jgi:hypothetical protein
MTVGFGFGMADRSGAGVELPREVRFGFAIGAAVAEGVGLCSTIGAGRRCAVINNSNATSKSRFVFTTPNRGESGADRQCDSSRTPSQTQ